MNKKAVKEEFMDILLKIVLFIILIVALSLLLGYFGVF